MNPLPEPLASLVRWKETSPLLYVFGFPPGFLIVPQTCEFKLPSVITSLSLVHWEESTRKTKHNSASVLATALGTLRTGLNYVLYIRIVVAIVVSLMTHFRIKNEFS